MKQNNIEIYKIREFGEFISTPITFFFQEFKLLAKSILFFVGPFILIAAVITSVYGGGTANNIASLVSGDFSSINTGGAAILPFLEMLRNIMLYSTIGVYVKLYVEKGRGNFTIDEIWKGISKFYFPVLGGQILTGLMVFVGILLLVIPGAYIGITLTILIPIIIFEEEGVGKAISRAFELIKGNWWLTFGVLFVFGMIFLMFIGVIGATIGGIFAIGGHSSVVIAISGGIIDFVTVIVTSAYALVPVFLYTSFIAEKEDPNLLERINSISKDDDDDVFSSEINKNQFSEKENNTTTQTEVKVEETQPANDIDVWEKLIDDNKKQKSEIKKEEKPQEKEENPLKKDDEEGNRFLGGDDNNRFKPKY